VTIQQARQTQTGIVNRLLNETAVTIISACGPCKGALITHSSMSQSNCNAL
jgi:hypothetical protein